MDPLEFSSKQNAFLSNFYPAPFILNGATWPTVEHWFQAQKFPTDPAYQETIRGLATPAAAKRLGRTRSRPLRPDWEQVKEEIMATGLAAKFTQNSTVRAALLATGERPLIEKAHWDSYWGSGPRGHGKNRMGALLVALRTRLASSAAAP